MDGVMPYVTATPRTATLRRKLQFAQGSARSIRALRFSRRQKPLQSAAEKFSFADLAELPDWIVADAERKIKVGLCAAILSQRGVIDRELSGERLVAISALVGGDLFERLCDYPVAGIALIDAGNRLPRPEDFAAMGEDLRACALPSSFRAGEARGGGPNDTDRSARTLCQLAASIIAGSGDRL